ncbi:MAG: MFS transporter [Rhodospirillales bacterium]|nr:MAG: MFS transporter [Rhodospirillales bacterium]
MSEPARVRLPKPTLLSYALPALVLALPTIPVYIHLPALYGVELGLGLAATGVVLLVARIFDTVTDPLIGVLSDRFGIGGNRRKPWIAAGAVVAGLGLFKILNPPEVVGGEYLLGWSLVLYAGWTMVAVPYLAWGAELSPDYNERTRITAWREGLMVLGIVGAGVAHAVVVQLDGSERDAVGSMAWIAIILGILVIPLLLWKVPDVSPPRKEAAMSLRRMREGAALLLTNGPFLRLLSAWFLNGLANGIPAALFIIYLEHGLGADAAQRSLFVLVYFLSAILAISLWLPLSRRFGKHRVWCWTMAAACLAFAAVPLIPQGAFVAFGIVCVITGVALGADLVLPPAIQADVIDYDRLRSGRSRAGLQFALWSMSTKLALAAAVGLALPALEATGFDPVAPDAGGIRMLAVIYALVPVVIKTAAIAVIWRFPLTAEKHAVIRRRLDRSTA